MRMASPRESRDNVTFISLVALRGQIMTVEVHSGVCMKYSRWGIYIHIRWSVVDSPLGICCLAIAACALIGMHS